METDFKTQTDFKIAIIGLGLIGGSMAYRLCGFNGGMVIGYDTNAAICKSAAECGAVTDIAQDVGGAIDGADLVIIATYPDSVAKIVKQNSDKFKKGAVITDICGVKSRISKEICSAVPDGVFYVGSHPMAGKEVEGFDNAEPTLFDGCGFIIVPTEKSDDKSIELVSSMARHLGAARLAVNTPEEHDSIIAYTSDLMHISASALCLNFNENMNLAYTAGAFRECTRIAMINPKLWTELFLENAEHIVTEIDRFSASLNKFRDAIANGRADRLFDILSTVRANKTDILKR
mgnify:FL=1